MAENTVASNTRTSVNNTHYRNLDLPSFILKSTEIDYFHIEPDVLSLGELDVTQENINLEAGEYLDLQRHFQSLDDLTNETNVLNVPVGHGKTTLCYKLMKKYYEEGYHIIVCSPFQKLVEKDHAALRKEIPNAIIFNYKELKFDTNFGGSFLQHLAEDEARIHVMTINCLLKNPGDEKYEQAFHKSRFLQKLKNSISNKGEKVVFFFDEIHESVANFKNEFIPNLTTWRNLTHKCFVSSATFTSASIPVIRYISYLTAGKIKIYYTPRKQSTRRSNLHLNLSTVAYSSQNLSPLNKIIGIIDSCIAAGGKVNILSAYKNIVSALTDRKNSSVLVHKILSLNPNICTADTDHEFNPNAHNIGTNFKTGVNITDSNSTLIVILPTVNKANPLASYGIFSDGIPAIIQSFARLRNGGNIHVFMYAPDTIIELENHKENIPVELYQNKLSRPHKKLNESYNWMGQKYNALRRFLSHEINFLMDVFNENEELKYHYPTFQEVLIEKSQNYLLSKNEWMGKYLSPYVLWASINNQFCNSTLQSITYQTKSYKNVRLMPENMQSMLLSLLSNSTIDRLKNLSIRVGFDLLLEALEHSEDTSVNQKEGGNMQFMVNDFSVNDNPKTYAQLKADRKFNYALLKIILFCKDVGQEVDKGDYLRTCIVNAASFNVTNRELPKRIRLYRRLDSLKGVFMEYVAIKRIPHKGRFLLHPNYGAEISDDFVKSAIELIYELKEEDKLLKAFTFFHNHKNILDAENITREMKNMIVNELEKYFLSISDNRVSYDGEKHYIFNEPIEIQRIIPNVTFLSE